MDVDLDLGDDLGPPRAGYRFEQLIAQHCRDWACEDAERDSWHDCLIWAHASGSVPAS